MYEELADEFDQAVPFYIWRLAERIKTAGLFGPADKGLCRPALRRWCLSVQGPGQATVEEGRQLRPRQAPQPRRAGRRPVGEPARPPPGAVLPAPGRRTRSSGAGPATPRSRTEKVHGVPVPVQGVCPSGPVDLATYNLLRNRGELVALRDARRVRRTNRGNLPWAIAARRHGPTLLVRCPSTGRCLRCTHVAGFGHFWLAFRVFRCDLG